ncbi:MAG: hypothetical protein NVSMB32_17610 [Actinomycetota bacterium]
MGHHHPVTKNKNQADLTSMPNIGPAMARDLHKLGIVAPQDLRGRDPGELYERLCLLDGCRHDPCVLDVFSAAVAFAEGGPARPWWEFSRPTSRAAFSGVRRVGHQSTWSWPLSSTTWAQHLPTPWRAAAPPWRSPA